MPVVFDAAAATTTTTAAPPRSGGATATSVLHRSRGARIALLALQACNLVLSVLAMALMAYVLYTARNIEFDDAGFVIHRASSALVVWAGAGGVVNAAAVGCLAYSAARRSSNTLSLDITGRQSRPLRLALMPLLALLALVAFVRTLAATCYSFSDFDRAAALAAPWDGEFDSRPAYFTPETYAANQGWGDDTSPEVAGRAAAARDCCATLTALAGVGLVGVLLLWRRERMSMDAGRGERVGSIAGELDGGGGEAAAAAGEVEGREVVELGEGRRRGEEGGGLVHETEGKQLHEMEGGAGAHEMQGRQVHEMGGEEWRVYEMDASEQQQHQQRAWKGDEEEDAKWERDP